MATFVDITEFMNSPHRTGIQRVCGELMRLWPEDDELIPVKITTSSRLVRLHTSTRSVIKAFFEASPEAVPSLRTEIARLALEDAGEAHLPSHPLLVPELFHDQSRIEFYRSLSDEQLERVHFIVFDMLHLTDAQFYPATMPFHIVCRYSHMLRRASRLAFISESVRHTYYDRLLRRLGTGPVLRLGSDGLGGKCVGAESNPASLHFSMIGTIEPRKRNALALDAFESLFPSHPNLSLTVVGRMGCVDAATARRFHAAQEQRPQQFRLLEDVPDGVIRDVLARSRASLFLSVAEGFGLPPVESLFAGTPVIASRGVPSLETTGECGVRLVDGDVESVRRAVLDFCNDEYYARKRHEAQSLSLPTWKSFCQETHAWVHGFCSEPRTWAS
jgi:glycosyltransferase involved in cell wall biosynthesis